MANIKSAKKRINTNDRERSENRYVKSTLATMVKSFRKLVAEGKVEEAEAKLNDTIAYINSACSKGVIHKNNASRKISRLNLALNKAKANSKNTIAKVEKVAKVEKEEKVEVVEEAKPAKKTTTKKVAAEKTEKAPAKKTTTAKKTTAKKEEK